MEVIANNMANASTAGFKRSEVFERNLIDAKTNFFNVPGDAEQDDPPIGSYTDFAMGALSKTDNPLDIAIDGKNGFFIVQDEDGNQFYTRAGKFQLSTDGTITARDGKKLMGEEGTLNVYKEFRLDSGDAGSANAVNIKITDNGEIFANESQIGTIKIANVTNPETLQNISNADFIATQDTDVQFTKPEGNTLKQGWLEESNVNIIKEMVQMIELQRLYETGSKVMRANDETLDYSLGIGRVY
jgi:flagellar basal-body rod protein FlgG